MAPTTNKSKPPARDFAKRPRAKVGKRAPAKVNATDTSFKTATVAVRSQGQSLDKSRQQQGKDATLSSAKRMELFSSRGNTLSTLQMSLRHHAAPVRASGLKGIRDAVQSLSSLDAALGVAILEANLPSLLPHLCRCWLDDDNDVRSLALNLYGDILKCLSSSHESEDLKCLAPFVPFLCAYASSALNSLDRSTRIDGASIVAMLASAVQSPSFSQLMSSTSSKMSAMSIELSHHVDSLLPSMERLLASISLGRRASSSDRSAESQKSITTGGQKRSRSGKNASSEQTKVSKKESRESSTADSILLSLAFLLRASLGPDDGIAGVNYTASDKTKRDLLPSLHVFGECSFLKGGSVQSNSVLLIRGVAHSRRSAEDKSICSIRDLPAIHDEVVGNSTNAPDEDTSMKELPSGPKEKDAEIMEKVQQMTSLLETLRGKFVELAHSGKKTDASGLMTSSNDLETMDVLVQIIRLSNSRFQSYYQTISKDYPRTEINANTSLPKREKGGKKSTKDLQSVQECLVAYQTCVDRVLQLLLESFPVKSFGETTNPERYEFTNACICSALAELGGGTLFNDGKKKASTWVDTVFSHVLPRFTSDQDAFESNIEADSSSESMSTNMLLKVVMKLLLPLGNNSGLHTQSYLLNNISKRQELLEAFAKAFFPRLNCPSVPHHVIYASSSTVELEQKIRDVAKTAAGRTACILVTKIVAQSADSFVHDSSDTEYATLLLQMLSVLPTFLVAWEGKYPTETGLALASILSVTRQWKANENVSEESKSPVALALEELCLGMRYSLEALFIPTEDSPAVQQPRKKRKKADLKQTCIFERLPEQVQKLAIGLVGLLQSPTELTATHLSQICSKAFISHHIATTDGGQEYEAVSLDMANYIREVVHLSRRTMPMPTYLSFLLDGSGIEQTTGISLLQKQSPDNVFLYDSAIDQLTRFLTTSCDKASQKVLPMLRPILEKWLLAPTKIKENEGASNETMRLLVQGRAAISILSAFTWDDVLSYNSADIDFVSSDDKLDQMLLDSILTLCEASGSLWSKGSYFDDTEAQQLYLARLLGPVAVLLRYRKGMLKQFLETVSKRVAAQGSREQQSEASNRSAVAEVYIKAILMILKSKDPVLMTSMIQRSDDLQKVMLSVAQTIETTVSGGPLAHLGGKLQHHVKTICSCNQ